MQDKELYAVKTRWQSQIAKLKLIFPILDFSLNPIFCSVFKTWEITGDLSTNDLCIHQDCLIVCSWYIYIYCKTHHKRCTKRKKKKVCSGYRKKTKRIKFKIIQASHHKINERVKHYRHSEDSMQCTQQPTADRGDSGEWVSGYRVISTVRHYSTEDSRRIKRQLSSETWSQHFMFFLKFCTAFSSLGMPYQYTHTNTRTRTTNNLSSLYDGFSY